MIGSIVQNGVEAMPDGGTLQISAENRLLAASEVPKLPAGQAVEIVIRDHGIGIPSDHLHRIFDPYFTGKKGGRGLGLAIVYSVIIKHGGHVAVDSEIGTGTSVTLVLPATSRVAEEPEAIDAGPAEHTGSVLVMDDEEVVRVTTCAMLGVLGYSVETATDGAGMLAKYREALAARRPFDVVIMDLTVPGGMGGVEGIKELLALDPDVRAIVSSGYSNDPVMANHQTYGFAGVVPKPYCLEDLSRTLRQVMARSKR